jgi:hypothetical protein
MKVKKTTLKIIAGITGAGLCITVYVILDQKHQDKIAIALMGEINKLLNPSATGLAAEQAFDIHYAEEVLKKVKNKLLMLKAEVAERYAKEIYDAFGFFDDDENKIYSVFRILKDKVQVSQVAKAYSGKYKVNLIEHLRSKLSNTEVAEVLKIVSGLVAYRLV